jgi:hypothetical protein
MSEWDLQVKSSRKTLSTVLYVPQLMSNLRTLLTHTLTHALTLTLSLLTLITLEIVYSKYIRIDTKHFEHDIEHDVTLTKHDIYQVRYR